MMSKLLQSVALAASMVVATSAVQAQDLKIGYVNSERELKEAASSLKEAADSLRGAKAKKKKRRGGLVMLLFVGAIAALVLSEDLRKKLLDALFGAEEEFEYTSTTTPASSGAGAGAGATVGSS